ncbi:PAS domain S-box protein [Rhodohalobacter sp. SW132]|uniref:PAS domain-containing sensor histidine kinase n=1 Tax=Rhodohalobacter sp. SW132 TaxID=2293433 RepID=UPI000E251DBE|nr:PAS domain S-box protein [Rhodohalobacter sp. SW132]REL29140.1 PAS domain S-box protein [Rhodohalobacter sp. SW132]
MNISASHILAVFRNLPGATLIVNADQPDFTIYEVNDAHLRFTGLKRENIVGKKMFDIFPGSTEKGLSDSARSLKGSFEKVLYTGESDQLETLRYDIEMPDTGEFVERHWKITNTPVFDESGKIIFIANSAKDVTKRVRSEKRNLLYREKLLKNKKKLDSILNHSPDIICTIDDEGRFVQLNRAVKKILKYSPEELEGKKYINYVTPEDVEKTNRAAAIIRNGRPLHNFENRYICADGGRVPLIWSVRWDSEDQLMYATARNGTEKVEAERELRERREFIETTLENLPIGIAVNTVSDGSTQLINKKFSEIYGWPQEKLQNVEMFFERVYPDPEYREEIQKMVLAGINTGKPEKMVWDNIEITTQKGEKKNITARNIPIPDQGLMISTVLDITKQKEYERELESSVKEKEVLLAEIHHRVKNNLAVVSSLMQMQVFKAEDEQLEKKLYDSMFRINTMATIHEILYQSGSFSNMNFSEIIKKLITNLQKVWLADKNIIHNIEEEPVQLNINQAIPCALLVNEVMSNTYKHAFSGREKGTVDVKLRGENGRVFVEINDNGIGLPEDFETKETDSLGIQLIRVLTAQLKGESGFKSSQSGTSFKLSFDKIHTGMPESVE